MAPERRQLLGVRHPESGRFGVCLFLPFGLGPSPGRNDCSAQEIQGIDRLQIFSLKITDFVGDLTLADSVGAHDELAVDMVAF